RIRERDDDEQLFGVADDDPLERVGVVGGAAQHGAALVDPNDPREGVGLAGEIADHVHLVAHHDRCAAQFPGAHGDDAPVRITVEHATPAAAIDGHHHGLLGVGVPRTGLGARTGTAAGTNPDIGFVVACGGTAWRVQRVA